MWLGLHARRRFILGPLAGPPPSVSSGLAQPCVSAHPRLKARASHQVIAILGSRFYP
jgi:hypothetical protein